MLDGWPEGVETEPRLTPRIPWQSIELFLEKTVSASVERPGQVSLSATRHVRQDADLRDFARAAFAIRKKLNLGIEKTGRFRHSVSSSCQKRTSRAKCACGRPWDGAIVLPVLHV